MRQGAAGWLHVNTGPADRLTQNWSDDDRCRGLVSRHNGLHKTGPGPSIWHGHVQGCRGLRQRRSGPFKVSSRAALFSMHLKSGQYSHLTAICASRHYFFSFGRIAYVLSIHFLAPVSKQDCLWRMVERLWEEGNQPSVYLSEQNAASRMDGIPGVVPRWWRIGQPPAHLTIRQNSAPLPAACCRTAALCTQIFLLPTNVSTNMMTEEERGGEILHYCCGDASIITGT